MSGHNCMNLFFFFKDTATTEIYTLSLHDALPISPADGDETTWWSRLRGSHPRAPAHPREGSGGLRAQPLRHRGRRSEEHTSELQSRQYLVCRLLLEKKKKMIPRVLQNTELMSHPQ